MWYKAKTVLIGESSMQPKVIDRKHTSPEHQGTKYKFWLENKLFKEGKVHGENWAEILAYELALLLNIPCAEYSPAELIVDGSLIRGTLSPNFVDYKNGERLVNANELLGGWLGSLYDKTQRYKHKAYTFNRSVALFKALQNQIQSNCDFSPIQQFTGYLLLDALIANQDRHHENWGFISSANGFLYLAPTYDHGASLACRLSEKERIERLHSKDDGYKIERFVQKAKSAFYHGEGLLKTYKLAELCFQHNPSESTFWVEKIDLLTAEDLSDVINCIPDDWMTAVEKEFTFKLLRANQQYLVGLLNKNV